MSDDAGDFPLVPGFKEGETSREAAEDMAERAITLRRLVYAHLFEHPRRTADETADALGESVLAIRPRFSELRTRGWIVNDGRGINISGKAAHRWVVADPNFEYVDPLESDAPRPKPNGDYMSQHSAILGGSNAARLLACPASYQEQLKAPVEDVTSPYAERGTKLHAAIAYAIEWKITAAKLRKGFDWTVYDLDIDDDENEVLAQALDRLQQLKQLYGGGFRVLAVEETLPLPGIAAAFGSVDLLLYNKSTIIVLDWKFGQGVVVDVLKDMGGGAEQLDAQLMFYALCARGKHSKYFKGRRIVVAIIQPSVEVPLSEAETSNGELDEFQAAFARVYNEALGRNPHMERGDHCKFARCKGTCPLWTGPVFDLIDINPAAAQLEASQNEVTARGYGPYLAQALELAGFAEEWITEIRRQAHVYLENGGPVPGWKLVPKRGQRQWLDPDDARRSLMGFADANDLMTEPVLKSVAQAEKTLKPKGITIPAELYHTVSSGTTIARSDDARPAANPPEVVIALGKALKEIGN